MTAPYPEPEPTDRDPPPDDRLTAYLFDLMDIGAKVAQSIGRQADQQAQLGTETPVVDIADQFERVARAMRRTALLIRHIAQNRAAKISVRTQARKRIIRDVEDAIQRAPRNNEALQAEFVDRLDSIDLEEEIASRPIEDVILDIRRDLGLENMLGNHPWERRTPRDVEALRVRAAAPPSPAYTPAEHPPDKSRPPNPNLCPDPARERRERLARI